MNRTDKTEDEIVELFDEFGIGLEIEDVVFTGDTIDDFKNARAKWNERGSMDEYDDLPAIHIEGGQPRKGMARGETVVIDLGSVRIVYSDHTIK